MKLVKFDTSVQFDNRNDLLVVTPTLVKNNDFSVSATFQAQFIPYRLDLDTYIDGVLQVEPYTINAYLSCNNFTIHTNSNQQFVYDGYQGTALTFTNNNESPTDIISGTVSILPLAGPPTYTTNSVTYGVLAVVIKQTRSRFTKENAYQLGNVSVP